MRVENHQVGQVTVMAQNVGFSEMLCGINHLHSPP
jgi:hypothetical protein